MMGEGSARLTLDGQMLLETLIRLGVVEDLLERSVFERCTVDVSCDPIVVEDGSSLCC